MLKKLNTIKSGDDSLPDSRKMGEVFSMRQIQKRIDLFVNHPQNWHEHSRIISHAALFLIAVLAILFAKTQIPQWNLQKAQPTPAKESTVTSLDENETPRGGSNFFGRDTLIRNALPFTQMPDRPRSDIVTYTVQLGDTVYDLAQRFRISPETLLWSNASLEDNPDLLRLGQQLVILPVNGVYHDVKKGDTIANVAKKYKVKPDAIVSYTLNKLTDINQPLKIGSKLIVPGGEKPVVTKATPLVGSAPRGARKGTGSLTWPTSGFRLTQGFWSRHPGVDFAAPTGTLVKASDSGYVVAAGWSPYGYGYHVIIDHGNGIQTLYAHLSKYSVKVGDTVARGQVIGRVGSTGNSTGPHLHFEVRVRGTHRNPLTMLR